MGITQNYARNEVLTIGTSEVLVSQKKKRKAFYIRNTSTAAQVITIAYDNINAVTSGVGIILAPGEFIADSTTEGYKCWDGDIKAISSAAGGTISVMEQPEEDNNGI